MRILHTSDWHLGCSLHLKRRDEELQSFLDWLLETVEERRIDCLIVAGDVFDTAMPSTRSQRQYFDFLGRMQALNRHMGLCRHVVIVSGNHDSQSFLSAPKALLKYNGIHVVGGPSANANDDVLLLKDAQGKAELIVAAVPYLRDGDVRTVVAGESLDDKVEKMKRGIGERYARMAEAVAEKRKLFGKDLPVVATGHLFVAGGQTFEDDGVRKLKVGTLGQVGADIFTDEFDYVALGHLHIPQLVNGKDTIRYSGSPIPMGFGEVGQKKVVLQVDFDGRKPSVTEIAVPYTSWRQIYRIQGTAEEIEKKLTELAEKGEPCWVEVVDKSQQAVLDLVSRVKGITEGTCVEALKIDNKKAMERLVSTRVTEELETMKEEDVFKLRLDAEPVAEDERPELIVMYNEILEQCLQNSGEKENGVQV